MMKIRWKHIVSSALALALCLSLAACGNSDDVAGEDWRTSGMVPQAAPSPTTARAWMFWSQ